MNILFRIDYQQMNILFKGSMAAAVQLIKSVGADVIECLVIMELTLLKGRDKLGVPIHSLIQYDH